MIIVRYAASPETAPAICGPTDSVGDLVYISGPKSGNDFMVSKVDNKDGSKMAAIAVIVSKSTPTNANIRFSGELKDVFTGLIPGKRYFVGNTGQPVATVPTPGSPTERLYVQCVGVATNTDTLRLDFDTSIIIRVGP